MIAWTMRFPRRVALVLIAPSLLAAGCRAESREPTEVEANGVCASMAFFDGHRYVGRTAVVDPAPGAVVGEARLPGCNDQGQASAPPDELIEVARLPGVDPSVAFVAARFPEIIYTRSDVATLPPTVAEFFAAPGCSEEDVPIRTEGIWLGIIGADGETELDLVPPYDVIVLVARSSAPRYVNAELTVRVSPSLGSPLTREDVEASLWEGGSVQIVSRCDGERFIAESVQAFPP